MKHWRNFDLQLVGVPLGLVTFGIFVLYAISRWPTSGITISTPAHQAIYAVMGLGFLFVLTNFDYRLLRSLALPLFVMTLGLLAVVLLRGHAAYGAQRWINVGVLPLQPSEPAKLLLVILLAKFFADRDHAMISASTLSTPLLFAPIPPRLLL